MSTRAYIGIQNKSGKSISYIYAHSDNYLEGVGKTLLNSYKTRQKVFRLIANGDASFVGPRINPRGNRPHGFDYKQCQKDVCVFYTRDRGDKKSGPHKAMSPESFRQHVSWNILYGYYIDNENVWWVSISGKPFVRLDSLKEVRMEEETKQKETEVKFSFKIKDKKTREEILGILNKFNVEYSACVIE